MDAQGLVFVTLGLFAAGVVKGATGIGYATCALPILTHLIGLKSAMALTLAPTFATNFSMAMSSRDVKETALKFLPLYAAMIPGVGAGVALLAWVDPGTAVSILGAILICYSLISLIKPSLGLSTAWGRNLRVPVGFANGVLAGLTGSQVIPLVPYMLALKMEPKQAVQAINLGVLILTTLLSGALFANSLVDPILLKLSVLAIVPALCGIAAGAYLQTWFSGPFLKGLVVVVVGLIGLKMFIH
jgi:uncharacterized protein